MDNILITEAIVIGIAAGLILHRLLGYLTIPIVGLGVGVWWSALHVGDIEGGTADIFNNQAPQLIADTGFIFALSAGQAALACWATIAVIQNLRTRRARQRGRGATAPDPTKPQRPT